MDKTENKALEKITSKFKIFKFELEYIGNTLDFLDKSIKNELNKIHENYEDCMSKMINATEEKRSYDDVKLLEKLS